MKAWARYLVCAVVGIAGGSALAISQVRGGFTDGMMSNGPWTTGKSFGTKDADALTRAKVALRGLLALPAKEAMYFTASTDSLGRPLEGRCRYAVRGETLEARWWSLTLYDPRGYLVANRQGVYSVGSGAFFVDGKPPTEWYVFVGPEEAKDRLEFIPTGNSERFELTLRAYHPQGTLFSNPAKVKLPTIVPVAGCQ